MYVIEYERINKKSGILPPKHLIFVKERLGKTVEQTSPQTSVTNEGPITQCCGSGMFISDQGQKDSGSASKTFLIQKIVSKLSEL